MGSSTRESRPPSAFGFGQGTQGYQAAPILMKNGQAFTRTGNMSQADYDNPMKRAMVGLGGTSVKRGVEPAPYSYQPISFGSPNQQANTAQPQAYGPGKYGVARRYGAEANSTPSNYYQSGQSVSKQAYQPPLKRGLKAKNKKARLSF